MIFSQTNAFSVTREVIVQSHGDEVVDCSTDVDQQQWRIDYPELSGTSQVATVDDRSRRQPVVMMSWQSSTRYCGDKPFSALYTRTAFVNSMLCRIGSQWSCLNTGVMCLVRRVPLTRHAAAFWTGWRRWTTLSVMPNIRVAVHCSYLEWPKYKTTKPLLYMV